MIDCRDPIFAPVYDHSFETGYARDMSPLFASLGEYVEVWTEGIRSGGAEYDGDWYITDDALAKRMNRAVGRPMSAVEDEIRIIREEPARRDQV